MKRPLYIIGTLLLCALCALGAIKLVLGLTGSSEVAGLAGIAAFVCNLFMIEPIRSVIKD